MSISSEHEEDSVATMEIQDEFLDVDKKYSGVVKQLLGGKEKARNEKLLIMALHLQKLQESVTAVTAKSDEDFAALNKQLVDQSSYLHGSISNLKDAENQLQNATDQEFARLQSLLAMASDTLSSSQKRSQIELASKLDQSASNLLDALETTHTALADGNAQLSSSLVQVSSSVTQVSASVFGVSKSLSLMSDKMIQMHSGLNESIQKTEKSVQDVQSKLSDSMVQTAKRVETIADYTQALGSTLSEFRTENKGQAKILDDVNKQVAKIQAEASKLEADMQKSGANLDGSLKGLAGEVSAAKNEIATVGSQMRETGHDLSVMESEVSKMSDVVRKLPSETSISKRVRQEFARKLLDGDEPEKTDSKKDKMF